jgi:hypothetical protein
MQRRALLHKHLKFAAGVVLAVIFLRALPRHLLDRAAKYQMLHGKRPPGLERYCGDEAYSRHLNQAHLDMQCQGIAYQRQY